MIFQKVYIATLVINTTYLFCQTFPSSQNYWMKFESSGLLLQLRLKQPFLTLIVEIDLKTLFEAEKMKSIVKLKQKRELTELMAVHEMKNEFEYDFVLIENAF